MAKAKKEVPKYESPYQEIDVAKNELTFVIEVINPEDEEEVEKQTNLKYEVLSNSTASYSESTLKRISGLSDKLFQCETEEEVVKTVNNAVGMSMTAEFRPRAFADVLRDKMSLITNEDYKKLFGYTLQSLDEHLCITSMVKSMIALLGKN